MVSETTWRISDIEEHPVEQKPEVRFKKISHEDEKLVLTNMSETNFVSPKLVRKLIRTDFFVE